MRKSPCRSIPAGALLVVYRSAAAQQKGHIEWKGQERPGFPDIIVSELDRMGYMIFFRVVEDLRHHLGYALRSLEAPGILEIFAHQDDTATRTAQGLMGGRSHDVSILNRVLEQTGSDQTGMLSKTLCGNGNLLVNIGPKPTGEMPEEQVERLYELTKWINRNREAVYDTHGGPFKQTDEIGSTYKD